MTSLSTQLRDISRPALITPRHLDSKWRPSFLFEGGESGLVDRETVLALAKNGFEELKSLDPSFTDFQRLFKSSYLDRDRGMLTVEQNDKLTLLLDDLLRRLSPYFPLRPTQKLFEWLITIHKVNHYNLPALLECVLPFYNTNLFVRVLQLLPLADKRSEWHWLKTVQKSKMSLSSLALVQHAISAPNFLNFICQLFINSIPTNSATTTAPAVTTVTAINFYVSSLVQVVTREHMLKESILHIILPSITQALKSQTDDVFAAGLIVTSYLATNCILSVDLCVPLVRMVCKAPSSLVKECIGCLCLLADTQSNFKLTRKCLSSLCRHPNSIEVLATLESNYKTDKLCLCLLEHFVEKRAQCEDGESATYILKSMQFDAVAVNYIFVIITQNYFSAIQEENGTPVSYESMVELGRILVDRYPSVVKEVVERMQLEYEGTEDKKNKFQNFLLAVYLTWSLDSTNGIDSENKLFLSLNHATSSTRRAAVLKIREQLTGPDLNTINVEFVRSSLLERFGDEDAEVVLSVLETGTPLFTIIPPIELADTLLDLCISGLDRLHSKNWRSCVLASLRLLGSDKFIASAPHTINAITLVLIELMFLRAPAIKLNTQVIRLSSEWNISHFSLLDGVSELVSQKNVINFDRNTSVRLLLSFNVSLLNRIADNITHMEMTSFECFIDYLISSLHSNKHSLISMSLLGITLHSLEQSHKFYTCKIASSYLQLITDTEYLFETLIADYRDTEREVTTKIQTILSDSTCNPNSEFVKRYAISRLSLWTMSAIITGLVTSHSSCPISFWSEDLSEMDLCLRVVFSLLSLLIELDLSGSSLRMAYKQILQQLLSLHLNESMFLSTCIANIITLPESTSRWHRIITPRNKIYALHMFNSFIESLQKAPTFAFVDKLPDSSPIIPALLIQLVSPNRSIRHISLQCLSAMCLQSHHAYQPLVASLLDRSTDIRANREFSTRVLSQLATGSIRVGKRRSTRLSQVLESHPLEPILAKLTNNSTPNHITSLFLSLLHSIDSAHAFPAMCSLLERCLKHRNTFGQYHSDIVEKLISTYTPTIAPLLTKENKGTEVLSVVLLSDLIQLHSKLIQKITSHFFESLPDETQLTFLSLLFAVLTDETHQYLDSTKATAREAICNITLNPTHISHVIRQNAGIELIGIETQTSPSPAKKKRTARKSTEKDKLSPKRSNKILSSLFELLLKCQLSNIETLLPLCFLLLSVLHKWRDTVDPLSLEYNNNLLFSLMTQAIKSVSPSKLYLFEPTFDVLQIIRTIQSTINVHVQVQGYLLLSEAAKLMPDRTIHNIMPIFTFMGTSIVRNDDGYSFQVILQAIESLVPPLVEVEGIDRPVLNLVTAVLQIFVDAYSHIPSHRRIALYAHLANVLGSSQYLYLLLILLILKDTTDLSGSTGRISFAKSLITNFDMNVQLSSLVGIARFLDTLVSLNRESNQSIEYREETAMLEDVSVEQVHELATHTIQLVTSYVSNKHFVKKLETARNESIAVDDYFSEIIELGLHYYEKNEPGKNNVQVVLLENVLALLTMKRFVEVFKRMPDHLECTTVDRMLEVLITKLESWHEREQLSSLNDLVELSPLLITLSCEQESSISGRKFALRSLKLIVQVLGPTALDRFRKLVKKLIRSVQSDCECQLFEVIGDKLLVMCELIGILNIQIVPKLPSLVPYLIERYNSSIAENIHGDTSASGCISVFTELLRHLANFLNPYLPELISLSIDHNLISEREDLVALLASIRSSIAQHVSFRILLSIAISLVAEIATEASKLTHLLSILEKSLLVVDKSELVASHTTLNELLIQTLDFRINSTTESEASISQVEEACANVYVNFVLKLSERAFKPLYLQMREWATNEDSASHRLIPFYLLSHRLACKLKSIFSIYLIYLVENAIEILNRSHSDTEEENKLFPEDCIQCCTLLKHLLKCVETCLKFDQEHILTREYFDLLKHPLTSQLTNCTGGSEAYQERVADYLIPCLSQFALRADQEGMRKELTLEILIISKNSSPRVKFATLLTLDSLFKLLKDSFLQVLPDSVPYLAELLEDESAEVEQQCQAVIATIEDILGDSIQQYF